MAGNIVYDLSIDVSQAAKDAQARPLGCSRETLTYPTVSCQSQLSRIFISRHFINPSEVSLFVPGRSLARFEVDDFTGIFYALLLVGVRRPYLADNRGQLPYLLLVGASYMDAIVAFYG